MRQLVYNYLLFSFIFLFSALFASSSPLLTRLHICLDDQRSALVQFRLDVLNYSSPSVTFDEFSSMRVMQWNLERDCCSWDGVTCDTTGHVIGLNLSYSMLSGHVSSIFNLHHLQSLNLARNNFQLSPIPSGFERLKNLTHLNLSFSCFSDQIPVGLSYLSKLISLDISTITFCELPPTFNVPDSDRVFNFEELHRLKLEEPNLHRFVQNMSALKELYLDSVDLSAQGLNWSEALAYSLPNLEVLSLSNCRLSGPIRPAFSQLKSLSKIRLDGNNLSSETPHILANFSNLKVLSLASCQLYGNFSQDVFLLSKLESVDLSKNHLLTGELPEFSSHSSLQQLSLYETNFQGKLPESIGNLKLLTSLLLSAANFSGLIPSSIANITRIVDLDLSANSFTGSIPQFHGEGVPNLEDLRLSYNFLSGKLYSSLFTLPSLQTLYVDDNRFSGELEEFSNASSSVLEYIYLNGNELSGPIPRSISKLPRLTYLSLAANNFSGTVKLDMFDNLKNLTSLDLSDNVLAIERDNGTLVIPQLEQLGLSSCNVTEVPKFLENHVKSMSLNLSNNLIQGVVPSWIWTSSIYDLDLSHNAVDFLETPVLGDSNHSGDGDDSYSVLGRLVMRSCNVTRFPDFMKKQDGLWYLDLSDNKIDGRAPGWIWKNNLEYLNISHNFLYAVNEFLPNVSLSSSLATLDLRSNVLQGSLPRAICNLSSLSILDASHNHLSGSIPECLGKLGNLSVLNLRGNKYIQIPPDFSSARSLRSLNINSNRLEGKLPRSLANCTMLEVLDLGNNQVSDTFPFWLENLPELKVLVLRSNRFHGPIEHPESEFGFPKLGIIDLSSNEFTGELSKEFLQSLKAMVMVKENNSEPRYIGEYEYYHDSVTIMNKGYEMVLVRILNIFVSLDLSNNKFHGEIPEEIGNLKSLVVLNLSRTGMDGHIPLSMEELTELESLDLSRNNLTGIIPSQLTSLTFLAKLDLSYNQLEGHIPQGNQFNTFSNDSFERNVGLCGLPLSKKCQESVVKAPPVEEFESSEEDNMFDWEFVLMGYGCGLVLGFSIAYTLFSRVKFMCLMNRKERSRKQGRRLRHGRRLRSR